MTPVNITVIFAKKNEIPSNGSTTVQIPAFLLIAIVFLGKMQMSSDAYNAISWEVLPINLTVTHTITCIKEIKTTGNVKSELSMSKVNYQCAQCNFNIHNNCL